jgi:hypothetical protein
MLYNDQIKEDDTARACSMREKRDGYKVFVGKPEGKRQVGRYKHRREDNVILDIKAIG